MEPSNTDYKSKVGGDSSNIFSANISSQLTEHFANLMDSNAFTDFVLKCAGEEIRVHKCILSARSPVFAAMFRNDMDEAQSNSVDIIDIDSEILRKLLKYIYSGQIDDLVDAVAGDLLYAAEKYQLDLLKEVCVENMKSTLSVNNIFDVLVIGELHDQSLKNHAIDFICKNMAFSELKKMDKWKSLQMTNPTLVIEVITSVVEYLQDSKSSNNPGIEAAAGQRAVAMVPTGVVTASPSHGMQTALKMRSPELPPRVFQQPYVVNSSYYNAFHYNDTSNMRYQILPPQVFAQQQDDFYHPPARIFSRYHQALAQLKEATVNPLRPATCKRSSKMCTSRIFPQAFKQAAVQVQGRKPITASVLADANAEEQKHMLGERLFPVIHRMNPDLAGKITKTLLELDNSELLHLLEHHESLKAKVREAVASLEEAHHTN